MALCAMGCLLMGVSKVFLWHVDPTRYGDQTFSGVLTVAPCTCCVNLHVCMYEVSILGVFEYFYHCITLLVFSCLLCFCFLIKF
jgi:hypothetical protein